MIRCEFVVPNLFAYGKNMSVCGHNYVSGLMGLTLHGPSLSIVIFIHLKVIAERYRPAGSKTWHCKVKAVPGNNLLKINEIHKVN